MIAYVVLALMLVGTAAALLAPAAAVAALVLAALATMRRGRRAFLLLLATALALNALLVSLFVDGAGWGPFSRAGALAGFEGGARLAAALGANLALLSWVAPARIVDGLRLPPRVTALLAAVLLAAHDVARDFERLKRARRLRGAWPRGRIARVKAGARLVPALVIAAHDRALARRDALRLAGLPTGARFAPIVAVAALAAAGRLAFLALPNVALTYVVVFLGGLLFGPLVGAAGGALGMLATDLILTGVYPAGLVNVPAMALLGLLGGACRALPFDGKTRAERATGAMIAASLGILATLAFSVAADTATWLLVLRDEPEAWRGLVLAGLAFNAIPALLNGALFAAAVRPTVAAWRARTPRAMPREAPPTAPESTAPSPAGPPPSA